MAVDERAWAELDARMLVALASASLAACVPPRRSYLWRLLRRSFRRRVAAVAVCLGEPGDERSPLTEALAKPAGRILAAEIFAAARTVAGDALPYAVEDQRGEHVTVRGDAVVEAERIGVLYGRRYVCDYLTLAKVLAAGGHVPFDLTLPRDWIVPPPRRDRPP